MEKERQVCNSLQGLMVGFLLTEVTKACLNVVGKMPVVIVGMVGLSVGIVVCWKVETMGFRGEVVEWQERSVDVSSLGNRMENEKNALLD